MEPTWIDELREAAERLARRLSARQAKTATASALPEQVPQWWREGIAGATIFGDGLMSLPSGTPTALSRAVTMLSADEIGVAAGGDYVPLAWLDGNKAVALVHDHGARPVVIAPLGADGAAARPFSADPAAPSLVAFLDRLEPQTVCRFAGPNGGAAIELCGDTSVLIEHRGAVTRRDFADDDDVGDFFASFAAEAIDAGMSVVYCPARLAPIFFGYAADVASPTPEVRAQAAIQRLVEKEALVLVEDADVESLVDDAARFIEKNERLHDLAPAFADWLVGHRSVEDLFGDDDTIRAALSGGTPDGARAS